MTIPPGPVLLAARTVLRLSVDDVADEVKIDRATLLRIEMGQPASVETLERVQRALEKRGANFHRDGSVSVEIGAATRGRKGEGA